MTMDELQAAIDVALAAEYTRGTREELEALLTIPAGTNNSERWLWGEGETRLHQLTKEPK